MAGGGAAGAFSRAALQRLMWDEVGLERDADGLRRAAEVIAVWRGQQRTPLSEHDFEDENLLLVAAWVVAAAQARTASVGAHFRSDDARVTAAVSA